MSVLSTCMSVYHSHAVPTEARRGHQNFWNWSHRRLWALWVLETKFEASGRGTSALNCTVFCFFSQSQSTDHSCSHTNSSPLPDLCSLHAGLHHDLWNGASTEFCSHTWAFPEAPELLSQDKYYHTPSAAPTAPRKSPTSKVQDPQQSLPRKACKAHCCPLTSLASPATPCFSQHWGLFIFTYEPLPPRLLNLANLPSLGQLCPQPGLSSLTSEVLSPSPSLWGSPSNFLCYWP